MQEYCYKCMRALNGSTTCQNCGYDNAGKSASEAPYHLMRGTKLAGRYLVGNVLGEGGFGITYIGLDTTLLKRVAVKEFYPSGAANRTNTVSEEIIVTKGKEEFFKKGVDRFLLEAKNVAAFSEEEGTVDVLDYFQENGTAYIVMEFLDGQNLKDYINTHGCFKLEELVTRLLPVMRSLSYMHKKGIIHRDISPDNIMFTKRGKLKLMDFGSARYYTNEERKMSVILKQGFAPEEQYRQNGEQGPHTDVYALCATIYACITGSVPQSSLDRLVDDTLKKPSELGVKVLPYQEKALMHGLALSRKNRTPDMDTLISELTTPTVEVQPTAAADYKPQAPAQPQQTYRQPAPPQPAAPQTAQNTWTNQPSYAPRYTAPQNTNIPPQNSYQPKPQKSKTPVIIAVIIAAVVLIGGGIALIIALNSGGDGKSGGTSIQTSVESSDFPSQIQSSISDSSLPPVTESSQSSISNTNVHNLVDSDGNTVLEDDAIDTSDAATQLKISQYLTNSNSEQIAKSMETDEYSIQIYSVGNVMVYEYDLKNDINETQRALIKQKVDQLPTTQKTALQTIKNESGIDNVVIAYVYMDTYQDVVAAALCK